MNFLEISKNVEAEKRNGIVICLLPVCFRPDLVREAELWYDTA